MRLLAGTRELATPKLALQCFIPAFQAMFIGIVPGRARHAWQCFYYY